MKWFKHFTDAKDSNDLTKVRMKYGADGYAVYWYCLECIAGDLGDKGITFELKHDAEVIAGNLKIDQLRVEEIMHYLVGLELFEKHENVITCLKLAKYLDKKTTRNKTIHEIIDGAKEIGKPCLSSPDCPRLSPDCPDMSPLDTDTDTDNSLHTQKSKDFEKPAANSADKMQPLIEHAVECFHEHLPNSPSVKGVRFGSPRYRDFARCIEIDKKANNPAFWDWLMSGIAELDFYSGNSKKANDWKVEFGWILKEANFEVMIERVSGLTKEVVNA